jgi:hypothetical protein
MGKYLKKGCQPSEQCFLKFVPKYVVGFSRLYCQKIQYGDWDCQQKKSSECVALGFAYLVQNL